MYMQLQVGLAYRSNFTDNRYADIDSSSRYISAYIIDQYPSLIIININRYGSFYQYVISADISTLQEDSPDNRYAQILIRHHDIYRPILSADILALLISTDMGAFTNMSYRPIYRHQCYYRYRYIGISFFSYRPFAKKSIVVGDSNLSGDNGNICRYLPQGTHNILSHAGEVGSPTNHPGSRQRQDTGSLISVTYKKFKTRIDPFLLRQGEPGTSHYSMVKKSSDRAEIGPDKRKKQVFPISDKSKSPCQDRLTIEYIEYIACAFSDCAQSLRGNV